jgi:hypothetical protein
MRLGSMHHVGEAGRALQDADPEFECSSPYMQPVLRCYVFMVFKLD